MDAHDLMNPLGWTPPVGLTPEQWQGVGLILGRMQNTQWRIGDWWNNGVAWGKGREACEKAGINYDSACTYGKIAMRYQFGTRLPNLSFAHHASACYIADLDKRGKLLLAASQEKDSLVRIRERVRALRSPSSIPTTCADPGVFTFASVCSGIEGASVAWEGLGWKSAWFAEIDPFCCRVLRDRYPDVPNVGDFTTVLNAEGAGLDLLIGGTPCQAFSVAGLREGLDDPRGNLTLGFLRLASLLAPRWIVWENVAGVLSNDGGRAFGTFLRGLAKCGYGWAYRVLDAQHFGVPQRRRRVFLVGHRGSRCVAPAAILFEARPGQQDARQAAKARQGAPGAPGRVLYGFNGDTTPKFARGLMVTLRASQGGEGNGLIDPSSNRIRKITVEEAERIQGFPLGYTLPAGTDPSRCEKSRRKAIGNSFAVPVVRWIGRRIQMFEEITNGKEAA